ncbi:polysaccharide deacetylase family protein [Campylobacter suis]|uniref:NodB homology domain-containing protein n=1 Tax=Campylobacter suis TaxID=2790657 RepID=A0ABM8Q111_9BACT|nr:polysaccharide deacetylase family protein [Campylobacter suis]CAD7286473.1 hypothetical protein LMG8286_00306 [Campylobacter suis]
MLISIMYHHLNSDRCSNDAEIFEQHLKHIKQNFTTIFAGESVQGKCVHITFDDAYADFYLLVFPLLKKYNLKATLAVPSKFILDDTQTPSNERLSFEHNDLFENFKKATFCTYKELKEMIDSGLVQIASHSHSHVVLTNDGVDLDSEIRGSKEILENKLGIRVDSLFFPYGKYNDEVLKFTKKHYKYAFRIGNAIQADFNGINGVIYRINGDALSSPDAIFKPLSMLKYRLKAFIKRILKK